MCWGVGRLRGPLEGAGACQREKGAPDHAALMPSSGTRCLPVQPASSTIHLLDLPSWGPTLKPVLKTPGERSGLSSHLTSDKLRASQGQGRPFMGGDQQSRSAGAHYTRPAIALPGFEKTRKALAASRREGGSSHRPSLLLTHTAQEGGERGCWGTV